TGLPRADRHVVPGLARARGRARGGAVARRPRIPRRGGAGRTARGRVPVRASLAVDRAAGECAEPRRRARGAGDRPSPSGARVTRALIGIVMLALAAVAEAALPAPPFTLDLAPTRVGPGQPVRLQITPRGGDGEFDVYVMWEQSEEAAFLTP